MQSTRYTYLETSHTSPFLIFLTLFYFALSKSITFVQSIQTKFCLIVLLLLLNAYLFSEDPFMSLSINSLHADKIFFRKKLFYVAADHIYLVECPFMRSCICSVVHYMLVFHILVSIRRDLSQYICRLEIIIVQNGSMSMYVREWTFKIHQILNLCRRNTYNKFSSYT